MTKAAATVFTVAIIAFLIATLILFAPSVEALIWITFGVATVVTLSTAAVIAIEQSKKRG